MKKQVRKNDRGVPDAPKMVWNKDGSPDFTHLQAPEQEAYRRNVAKDKLRVPSPLKMKWHTDGSPDWSHL